MSPHFINRHISKNNPTLYEISIFTDDCLYIFYICTDNVDGWPKNKNICTRLFEECEANLPEEPEGEQGVLINPPTVYFF